MEKRLYDAALEGNVSNLKALIQEDPLILDRITPTFFQDTPLHIATLRGHLEFARVILSHNPRLATESDLLGHFPLHVASAKGHIEIVRELLRVSPSSCLARSKDGKLPLHLAIMKGVQVDVVSQLALACPESILSRVDRGDTVLHLCVKYGNLDALQVLMGLLKGENNYGNNLLNVRNDDGNTVLHLAALQKHLEITKYLLGAPNVGNDNGLTVLDLVQNSPKDLKGLVLVDFLLQSNCLQQSINNHSLLPLTNTQPSTSHPSPPSSKKFWKKFFTFNGHNQLQDTKESLSPTGKALAALPKTPIIKCVEELIWQLQLEKHMRTDVEEAKVQETAKLQEALHTMRLQLEEAEALVIKEKEAAVKTIEEATEKIDLLTAELETVKALLQSETQSKEEVKQSCATLLTKNEELIKKLEEVEDKTQQFQESTLRLEEKVSNLESENQVLRQQVVAISPTGKALAARPKTVIIQTTPENGNVLDGEINRAPALPPVPYTPESEAIPHKLLNEKQQENQDHLIKCISQDLGFSKGKPMAACLLHKSLLQWRLYEVESTNIFDRIIQTISAAIEARSLVRGIQIFGGIAQDNNDVLSYWLSNSATLLLLLQRTLKASGAVSLTTHRRRTSSASLFGRLSQGSRASPQKVGFSLFNGLALGEELHQVEAKYPALLFKQQLTALLEKIYKMIRDNLKKEISPVLGLCIQAPRTSRASLVNGRAQVDAVVRQALIAHWQSIVEILSNYLNTMRENYAPPILIRKVFAQTFWFVNVELFNSLLLRRECCSFSNAEYVKEGLAKLEQWCHDATEEYAGSSWEELKHIKQAVGFLVIHQKPKKSLKEITNDFCPALSIQQLYQLSTMYWDDKYDTHSISDEVKANMRVMVEEDSKNDVRSKFLLDDHDDSRVLFSVDDIVGSMKQVNLVDINPPLRENSGFAFLFQHSD